MRYKYFFILFVLCSIKCSAQYFEGTITYKTVDKPETKFSLKYYDTTWVYTAKGNKVRYESSSQFFDKYYIQSDIKSGEISYYTIDTIQNYYEVVIDEAGEIYNFDTSKKYKRRKRKDENILGYNCKYYYTKGNYSYEIWITDSIIPEANSAGLFIRDKGVVLKRRYKSSKSEYITYAVDIEPKPISDELFKIPADCKPRKSSLPAAMIKYGVDEKSIPRDSLRNVKDTTKTKIDLGKWE